MAEDADTLRCAAEELRHDSRREVPGSSQERFMLAVADLMEFAGTAQRPGNGWTEHVLRIARAYLGEVG